MADDLPQGYRAPGPPPKDALDFFREKGFKIGFDYRDVWREEHVVAFTVAKAMEYDLLVMIRQAVDAALAEGIPFEKFAKELQPLLEEKGWWGKKTMIDPVTGEEVEAQLGSPRRLRTIYDTNLRMAYNAGQWDRTQRTKKALPYILRTVGPSREHRPQHLAWHGTLLKADDPWWKTHWAPDAWGCKCRQRQVSKYEYQRLVKDGVQPPLGDETAIRDEQGRLTGQHRAEKVPVQTTPPPAKMVEWTNKRTGETIQIEEGFDPGFDYNPGLERQTYLKKLLDEKAAAFDSAMEEKPVDWRALLENDQVVRGHLEAMAEEAGWAERGGFLIRDEKGNVTGRTKWAPKSQWWGDYKAQNSTTLTDKQAIAALQKALKGEKLSKKEARFVEWSTQYIQEQRQLDRRIIEESADFSDDEVDLAASLADQAMAIFTEKYDAETGSDILSDVYNELAQSEFSTPAEYNQALISRLESLLKDML